MGTWLDDFVAASALQLDERVREALWSRGASDDQIEEFTIGYVDGELPPAAYPTHFLEWSGHGSKLKDAFVFPLTNLLGEVRGIQMRAVDRSRREYMDFFLDKFEPVYFGLGQAAPYIWQTEEVGFVEGVFDFFPVQRVKRNAVSTLTAKVSETLLRAMKRLARKYWLFYDADRLGQAASSEFLKENKDSVEAIQLIEYPHGVTLRGKPVKDPGDLWEAWGDERFRPFLLSQLEPT